MGYIYTGFVRGENNVFKIGMTNNDSSPNSRLYANNIADTGCIRIPKANKSTLTLLESVARYTLENACGLSYWHKRDDFFTYDSQGKSQAKRAVELSDAVIYAVIRECEMRSIPYELHLRGFTAYSLFLRWEREDGTTDYKAYSEYYKSGGL